MAERILRKDSIEPILLMDVSGGASALFEFLIEQQGIIRRQYGGITNVSFSFIVQSGRPYLACEFERYESTAEAAQRVELELQTITDDERRRQIRLEHFTMLKDEFGPDFNCD